LSDAGQPAQPQEIDPLAEAQQVKEWLNRIALTEKYFETYFKRAEKIVTRYRDERDDENLVRARRFNLLWSNVQTLGPAVYAKPPKMNVTRRYHDQDPLARISSMVLERAVDYEMDCSDFDEVMLQARDDYLLCGRGTFWQRYEPTIVKEPVIGHNGSPPLDDEGAEQDQPQGLSALGQQVGGGAEESYEERLVGEKAPLDYTHWKDFLHDPAPTWKRVKWVGRKVLLSKDDATKRFGAVVAALLSYTHRYQKDDRRAGRGTNDAAGQDEMALVYEVWDKPSQSAMWFSPDVLTKFLDRRDDPLGLRDFFPCPKPLYATLTTDRLIPVPDYALYQDQAQQIDELTQRIALLTKAVAVRGAYDRSSPKLADLLNEKVENTLVAVDSWAAFAEKGGLKGQISFLPIDAVMAALAQLVQQRGVLKQDVYEITGIADIIRGASAASETATAQRIKGNFATLRLDDRRKAVSKFARDGLRLTAEVISEHFEPQTIRAISGFDQMTEVKDRVAKGENADQLFQQVHDLIKNDPLRFTHLDIETDSMIDADQQQEKQDRTEFLQAAGSFLREAVAAGQQMPRLSPLLGQMLLFGVRGFKAGRELEESFESAIADMQAAAQNAPAPGQPGQQPAQPPQDPAAMAKVQNEAQRGQAELQIKAQGQQADQQQAQAELQQKAQTDQADIAFRERELEINTQLAREELALKFGLNPYDSYKPFVLPKPFTTSDTSAP
jgi:hypothetical protein